MISLTLPSPQGDQPIGKSPVCSDTGKRRTRGRTRTDNLLDLNQTPLPKLGYTGKKRPTPTGGCGVGLSAPERSRTFNNSDLNAAPLPLGYRCKFAGLGFSPRATRLSMHLPRPWYSWTDSNRRWPGLESGASTAGLQEHGGSSPRTGRNLRLYHIYTLLSSQVTAASFAPPSFPGFPPCRPSDYYSTGASSRLSTPLRKFFVLLSSRTRSIR